MHHCWFVRVYHLIYIIYRIKVPKCVKQVLFPIALLVKYRITARVKHLHLPIYVLDGKEKSQGSDLRVLFIGNAHALPSIFDMFFAAKPLIKHHGVTHVWNIKKVVSRFSSKTDIVCILTDRFFDRYFRKKGYTVIPEWVEMNLDISQPLEVIHKRFHKSAKEDIRSITKRNYSYEITANDHNFSFFYHKLCVPFMKQRHGELMLPEAINYQEIRGVFERGELLLVKDEDTYIGGLVIKTYRKDVFSLYIGIATNLSQKTKCISSALFYFTILWAKGQGFHNIHFGDTRPFLNNGLFLFKRKWGASVQLNPSRCGIFCLKTMTCGTKAVNDFLLQHPFMHLDKKSLIGQVFVDASIGLENSEELRKRYATPGIKQIYVSLVDGNGRP